MYQSGLSNWIPRRFKFGFWPRFYGRVDDHVQREHSTVQGLLLKKKARFWTSSAVYFDFSFFLRQAFCSLFHCGLRFVKNVFAKMFLSTNLPFEKNRLSFWYFVILVKICVLNEIIAVVCLKRQSHDVLRGRKKFFKSHFLLFAKMVFQRELQPVALILLKSVHRTVCWCYFLFVCCSCCCVAVLHCCTVGSFASGYKNVLSGARPLVSVQFFVIQLLLITFVRWFLRYWYCLCEIQYRGFLISYRVYQFSFSCLCSVFTSEVSSKMSNQVS